MTRVINHTCIAALLLLASGSTSAQLLTYPAPHLLSVYPAGGCRGEMVEIELLGQDGVSGANQIVVDGPPGVSVEKVDAIANNKVKATLKIAADAPLGRRMLRVVSPRAGMTNFRYFFVGGLAEVIEKEPNSTAETAHEVTLPIVINGRISPTLDIDMFRFQAKAGQRIVAAILGHGMDAIQDLQKGYLDTSLELRDANGKVIAAAEDTVGLDPILSLTIPADGAYTLVVTSLQFLGSDHSVYRLTVGDVPYPTSVYPAGGRRGDTVPVEIDGFNLAAGTRTEFVIDRDGPIPTQFAALEKLTPAATDLTLLRGEHPEVLEVEPNNDRATATPITLPITANGRFSAANDEDWFRTTLKKGEAVRFEVATQRFLNTTVDSHLELYDSTGKLLVENDDGAAFGGAVQCAHDFISNDSWLAFTAPTDGEYALRVRDLNGSAGSRAVYRLTCEPYQPDFLLYQWPDAVPIWGPGTTAALVVEVLKWGQPKNDITVRVEGLPPGWKGSVANRPVSFYPTYDGNGAVKLLLAITAPVDAAVGTIVPFKVIGRLEQEGRVIEHEARYMTLYGNAHNDRMHTRPSLLARAVVCEPLDSEIETTVTEISVVQGQTIKLPAKIKRHKSAPPTIGVVINGPTPAVNCGLRPPITLTADQSEIDIPLTITEWQPGDYDITIARSWGSDLRGGRPGPCTPLIRLHVLPPTAAK